jgi:ABC-type dipeptide/oligopeptide/nickel transport system permease component
MTSRDFPAFAHLILPAITLASVSTAYCARIMRSQLLEVTGQDYIRTASAKGLSYRRVIGGHAMKNALIPVVTFLGLDLGAMIGGTILTETVFNWPGLGLLAYEAMNKRDYPVMQMVFLIASMAVIVANLIADLMYYYLDPRVQA